MMQEQKLIAGRYYWCRGKDKHWVAAKCVVSDNRLAFEFCGSANIFLVGEEKYQVSLRNIIQEIPGFEP